MLLLHDLSMEANPAAVLLEPPVLLLHFLPGKPWPDPR